MSNRSTRTKANMPRMWLLGIVTLALVVSVACASDSSSDGGSSETSCEYHAFGVEANVAEDFTMPSAQSLGEFEYLVLASVTGIRQTESTGIYNIIEVDEVVVGPASEGDSLELISEIGMCLEAGRDYYLIFSQQPSTRLILLNNPWAVFPVINNRITLHPDMRKDELIGDMHGLDPVLFKRRFVDLVERDDIEVD